MRALHTRGLRGPRIAFATSRKGPQARHLSLHPTPRNATGALVGYPCRWNYAKKVGFGERVIRSAMLSRPRRHSQTQKPYTVRCEALWWTL